MKRGRRPPAPRIELVTNQTADRAPAPAPAKRPWWFSGVKLKERPLEKLVQTEQDAPKAIRVRSAKPAIVLTALGVAGVLAALAVTSLPDATPSDAVPTPGYRTTEQERALYRATGLRTARDRGSQPSRGKLVEEEVRRARLRKLLAGVVVRDESALRRILTELLRDTRSSPEERRWLADTLDDVARDREQPATVRRTAVALLSRFDRSYVFADPFIPLFDDPDPIVRAEAVAGRARHGLAGYESTTIRLARDPSADVRVAVAAALGTTSNERSQEVLLDLLQDADRDVVRAAARSFARVWSGPLPERLVEAASSDKASVRLAVALALEPLRGAQSTEILCRFCVDPDWQVRDAAVTALGNRRKSGAETAARQLVRIAYDETAPRLDRFQALQALVQLGAAAEDTKIAEVALGAHDPLLRLMACRTALSHRDLRVIDALPQLLDVEIGGPCDEEDVDFIHRYALKTLQDATGSDSAATDAASWERTLSALRERGTDAFPKYTAETLSSFR